MGSKVENETKEGGAKVRRENDREKKLKEGKQLTIL